jgi:hypothetical protein
MSEQLKCLNGGDGLCQGPVDYWTVGNSLKGWPRCDYHGQRRIDQYENSMERYADSDVPPPWFDPADAGERFDSDY